MVLHHFEKSRCILLYRYMKYYFEHILHLAIFFVKKTTVCSNQHIDDRERTS
jgi:hypothetical protein